MRSNPAEYTFVSPGTLAGALDLLHREPEMWLPLAGGTEVMVQYSSGRLGARRLLNLWNIGELKQITESVDSLRIGGGCTFAELREHPTVQKYFPLLAKAAAWTGSIANQNRATIAGNIVNASPAADSPPALLAYEAELELVSATGTRRLSYRDFHLAYKKTALKPNELLLAIHLPKRFVEWFCYCQKTGTRNAQAISKVCIAGVGKLRHGRVEAVHLAIGAVAPIPLCLRKTEKVLLSVELTKHTIAEAQRALASEISPIEDIRSSAEYRRQVAANLLEDLLQSFAASEHGQ
jgi:Aerobic-type carbon monoxide dehydrogenase, middle subunit CoxM/CutM homologs